MSVLILQLIYQLDSEKLRHWHSFLKAYRNFIQSVIRRRVWEEGVCTLVNILKSVLIRDPLRKYSSRRNYLLGIFIVDVIFFQIFTLKHYVKPKQSIFYCIIGLCNGFLHGTYRHSFFSYKFQWTFILRLYTTHN